MVFNLHHLYFIIKTSIKFVGFFYLFFMTLLSNHFYPGFFFLEGGAGGTNYCVLLLLQIFRGSCGWLWFADQPKLLIFTLGIQTFVLP